MVRKEYSFELNGTTSHLPGYPWPPEEEYLTVRDDYYNFPEDKIDEFVKDFSEIREVFVASIAKWNPKPLWENGAPDFRENFGQPQPSIALKVHPKGKNKPTIVVCPGGGFLWKASYEGMPVAERFYEAGFNAAVLCYRVAPYHIDVSFEDAHRAIRYLRANAENLGINPDKIVILGFSAGGRVASIAGTAFDEGDQNADDPIEKISSRPNAVVVCYGARSMVAFPRSGLSHNRERQKYFATRSADALVSVDTPPFYIWQSGSMDDPRHALNLVERLTIFGVPFELHLFPYGAHGTALSDGDSPTEGSDDQHIAKWVTMCIEWINIELVE